MISDSTKISQHVNASSFVKRIFLNTFSGYINFVLSAFVLYLLTPYILKHLGVSVFGLWSLIFSVMGFFELIDLGFYTGVIKFVSQSKAYNDQERCNRILSTTFCVYISLAFIGCFILGVFATYFNEFFDIPADLHTTAINLLILLALRSILIGLPLAVFRGLLFGEQYIYIINFTSVFITMSYVLSAWYLLSLGYSIITLGVLNLLSVMIEYLVYVILSFVLVPGLKISFKLADLTIFKELFSFSMMQFVANISNVVMAQSAPILVKLFFTLETVTLYAITLRIINYIYRFTKQYTGVLTPIIAHLHVTEHHEKIRSIFINGTKYALVPSTLFLVLGLVFSHDFISLWVGKEYLYAATLLTIMLLTMWVSTIQIIAIDVIAMSKSQHLLGRYFSLSLLIYIITSVILTYVFGILGVAFGILFTSVSGIFLWVRTVCVKYEISYLTFIKKSIMPLFVVGGLELLITSCLRSFFTPTHMITILFLALPGVLIFLVMFWMFFIDNEEKEMIKKYLKDKSYA